MDLESAFAAIPAGGGNSLPTSDLMQLLQTVSPAQAREPSPPHGHFALVAAASSTPTPSRHLPQRSKFAQPATIVFSPHPQSAEKLSEEELACCLAALLGDEAAGGVLPPDMTAAAFASDVLGFDRVAA